jgi:hypothetical protein
MRSANRDRRGAEAEFFTRPASAAQRRYELLRAYFVEGASAGELGERFALRPQTVQALVRSFRRGERDFFLERRPGPRRAPRKEAARGEVLRLRRAGHSITEIEQALAGTATPLNRTGIWELLREEGEGRLRQRPARRRGPPRREPAARARVLAWPGQPATLAAEHAGALLLLPGLVTLGLPAAVEHAGLPGTRQIPALSSLLSLLALKLVGRRRTSHVDDLADDPALSLLAGLETLPKATALGSYSYRLARAHAERLLEAVAGAARRAGQIAGRDFDLDFHAIRHYGEDVALEEHYVPRRSQRTESVLTFFAQDGDTRNLVYADATVTRAEQAGKVLEFARHIERALGERAALLVFDSRLTTGAGLEQLDRDGIAFLTLRQRNPALTRRLGELPGSEWTSVRLGRHERRVEVNEQRVRVRGCERPLRQLAVRGLGHAEPTLLLTNESERPASQLIDRYRKRMTIEQRLAEAIRTFHLDALSSAVALNVDLDTTLTVIAQLAYDDLRRRLPGYEHATPDTIWRRFVSTRGHITLAPDGVVARLARRTYSPVLRSAELPEIEVPWWQGRRLRLEFD